MRRSHTLRVVTADETIEREIRENETISFRGETLKSWPARDLSCILLPRNARIIFIGELHGGEYVDLPAGSWLSVGSDKWHIGQLRSFELTGIPLPVEIAKPPSCRFRVRYFTGTEEVVELSAAQVTGAIRNPNPPADEGIWEPELSWGRMLSEIESLERVEEQPESEPVTPRQREKAKV